MSLHLPGLVWAVTFWLAAVVVRVLPPPSPPSRFTDRYLYLPSSFPSHLASRGLHRPMAGKQSGMSEGMEPYQVAGIGPRTGDMRSFSRKLAGWGAVWLLLAVASATGG
ncbi:MAG: hypothetical protein ACE5KX_06905 [Acidimicrobiia bacterium]